MNLNAINTSLTIAKEFARSQYFEDPYLPLLVKTEAPKFIILRLTMPEWPLLPKPILYHY